MHPELSSFAAAVAGDGHPPGGSDPLAAFDEFDGPGGVIPAGTYTAVAVGGKLTASSRGTPGFRLEFRISDPGEHQDRRVWSTLYLSPAALPFSKPVLKQFGLDTSLKLKSPFPRDRYVCRIRVVVRKDDDGLERNEVRDIRVVGQLEPARDAFAPSEEGGER